jgi:hypothetical protein
MGKANVVKWDASGKSVTLGYECCDKPFTTSVEADSHNLTLAQQCIADCIILVLQDRIRHNKPLPQKPVYTTSGLNKPADTVLMQQIEKERREKSALVQALIDEGMTPAQIEKLLAS